MRDARPAVPTDMYTDVHAHECTSAAAPKPVADTSLAEPRWGRAAALMGADDIDPVHMPAFDKHITQPKYHNHFSESSGE